MEANFDKVMDHIFLWEGGYVDHPRDPGGATNMGITFQTLEDWRGQQITKQDVRDLTRNEAEEIYFHRYWMPVEAHRAPVGLDLVLMDAAVNSGVKASVRWLQRALRVDDDGVIGPVTRKALKDEKDIRSLVTEVIEERRKSVRQFGNYGVFGRGWENRINSTEKTALEMLK